MVTLTLKNMPGELHAKLKAQAERNRRSLNSEILVQLEMAVAAPLVDRERHARELAAFVSKQPMQDHGAIGRFKRQGRP
jgi:hypothetical protein